MNVSPVRNPTFVTLSDGTIRNAHDVRLRNEHGEPRDFRLPVAADGDLRLDLEGEPGALTTVPADATAPRRVHVGAGPDEPSARAERTPLRIWATDVASGERAHRDTVFSGRESFDDRSGAGG